MGDVFIQYDDAGRKYFHRLIYVNILFYVLAGIIYVVTSMNIVVLFSIAIMASIVSLLYIAYFIYKNPPREYNEELT